MLYSNTLTPDPHHSDASLLACLTYHTVLLGMNREEILRGRLLSTGCHLSWIEAEALNSLMLIFYLFLLAVIEHSESNGGRVGSMKEPEETAEW